MGIKELEKEEIPMLVEMVFRYKLNQDPDFSETQKKKINQAFINTLNQPKTKVLVYINDQGLITGYVALHLIDYPMIAGKEVYISDLLISESERGKGIGGKLLGRVEQFAKENQCARLMLNNPKESEGYKRSFYKKHGFTERIAFANFIKVLT